MAEKASGSGCLGGAAFLLAGLALSGLGVYFLGMGLASKTWPSVPGTIVQSGVNEFESDGDSSSCVAVVVYSYVAHDFRHMGDRIAFSATGSWSCSGARKLRDRFPAGREVPVYYNPKDPAEAVLIPGTTWIGYFLVLFGSPFVLIGYLLLRARYRRVTD